MLTLEELEKREVPSVTIRHGVYVGIDGEPSISYKGILGDPQHSPGHVVWLPGRANMGVNAIYVGA
jgi:hypothetical protein